MATTYPPGSTWINPRTGTGGAGGGGAGVNHVSGGNGGGGVGLTSAGILACARCRLQMYPTIGGTYTTNTCPNCGSSSINFYSTVPTHSTTAMVQTSTPSMLFRFGGGAKPKLENTGVKVGEIIGYRIWKVEGGSSRLGPTLYSYGVAYSWPQDRPATGNVTDHGHEGIWAFKDSSQAIRKLMQDPKNHAYGSVKLWGDIVEHDIGYRASFAKVNSIDYCPDLAKLSKLREIYGVEITK